MILNDRAVVMVATQIAEGCANELWSHVTAPLQKALIDAGIMAHVTAAWSADADKAFTAADLVNFRQRVVELLAAGVGRGHRRRAFKIDE